MVDEKMVESIPNVLVTSGREIDLHTKFQLKFSFLDAPRVRPSVRLVFVKKYLFVKCLQVQDGHEGATVAPAGTCFMVGRTVRPICIKMIFMKRTFSKRHTPAYFHEKTGQYSNSSKRSRDIPFSGLIKKICKTQIWSIGLM